MALMTDRPIRHLPVVDDRGSVVGIVSIGDVVEFKSKQQSFEINPCSGFEASCSPPGGARWAKR